MQVGHDSIWHKSCTNRAEFIYILELSLKDGTGGNDQRRLRFNNGKTIDNKNS
jgi:hypothetical protein